MKILLECLKVEKIGDKQYEAKMSPVPNSGHLLTVILDCPVVPGTLYELMLRGVYPGTDINHSCVGPMLSFSAPEHLTAVDIQAEYQYLEKLK